MCDPVTALVVAAAVVTAGGQIYSSQAEAAQLNYQAKVANENRKHELNAAADSRKRGELEQMRHWRRVAALQGQQRAEMGAAGLDLGFGSALDIQDETLAMGFEDSTLIEQNTDKEVLGYHIRAANYKNQARAAKAGAKSAKISGYIGAASTLLGAGSQVGKGMSSGGGGAASRYSFHEGAHG
jgi:hypothetical protein